MSTCSRSKLPLSTCTLMTIKVGGAEVAHVLILKPAVLLHADMVA
jgi:hypothetical protein